MFKKKNEIEVKIHRNQNDDFVNSVIFRLFNPVDLVEYLEYIGSLFLIIIRFFLFHFYFLFFCSFESKTTTTMAVVWVIIANDNTVLIVAATATKFLSSLSYFWNLFFLLNEKIRIKN